jgi:uncharacterized membrane protein
MIIILCATALFAAAPAAAQEPQGRLTTFRARLLEVGPPIEEDLGYGMIITRHQVRAHAQTGPLRGTDFTFTHSNPNDPAYDINLRAGMDVVMSGFINELWIEEAFVEDIARDRPMVWLTAGFVALLVAVGGRRGVRAAITLAITVLLILRVMLPALLAGSSPVAVSILIGIAATLVTVLAVGGVNRKSATAIIGTVGGVIAAGTLAWIAARVAHLTGLGAEEVRLLVHIPQGTKFNLSGLLFAGMLIGAMGAIMDVGMSIASSMDEVRRANPSTSARNLLRAGMNVGRDVMGTMANTLVLAYAGASIPLLLLFMAYDMTVLRIISLDLVATEVVRALTGSMGLVLSIPLTALAGTVLLSDRGMTGIAAALGARLGRGRVRAGARARTRATKGEA